MAFFDDIGRKIVQVGNDVYGKTKDATDIVKINSLISEQQKILNQYFSILGKKYYDSTNNQNVICPDELELFEKITKTINVIDNYQEKIKFLKGIEKCPVCNGDIISGSQFCSHCGNKIVRNDKLRCPKCGTVISDDAIFCTNCGMKIEIPELKNEIVSENDIVKEETTMEYFEESMQNRVPNENECQCQNCGNIQSKTIKRCLKCSELIVVDVDNEVNRRLCPNCQSPLEDDQCFCTNCGVKIENDVKTEMKDELFNKCPNCNADIDDDSVFCTNCGFKLIDEED